MNIDRLNNLEKRLENCIKTTDSKILKRKISSYDRITNILNYIKTIFVFCLFGIGIYSLIWIAAILDMLYNNQ